jgi:hypothetical protein
MPLSWNEIKDRAVNFSKEWKDAFNENADGKPFLVAFFNVFGINQRKVGTFEFRVKKLDDHDGYIDMLWKGNLLIEMKSRGKDLGKAWRQANDYMQLLKQYELPRYVLLCDFARFRLIDLEGGEPLEFRLEELVNNVHLFGFVAGYFSRPSQPEDAVNIAAAELMGRLHDDMKEAGYTGHELEKYLVRLLFCLFADDTGIFEPRGIFYDYLALKTNEDGSDLGLHLAQIFQVLNTPPQNRQLTLDENLAQFPYVNGQLFAEQLLFASFNSKMRKTLIACCHLDWGRISPAIFGSMFQSVMNPVERRNLGAHYTSEKNIMKLIRPLFLDKLWEELENSRNSSYKLKALHKKIASLRFLDPACGCGNFLVITYREIRLLELAILKQLFQFDDASQTRHVNLSLVCDVDRFYGIESEEFPAQIAQVAMWLMDHQMNQQASQEFGEYYVRLPLKASAKITHGNALRTDWNDLIELLPWESHEVNPRFNYILGNPPFIGKHLQNASQKSDMELVMGGIKGAGVLDYVTAWYIKAAQYLQVNNNNDSEISYQTQVAFVSTNSISQGEQVGVLWNELFNQYKIKIHFAHRTFKWGNEARGNAAVHVVIIGFSNFDISEKRIYEYEDIKRESNEIKVKNISPYLVEGSDLLLFSRSHPINNVPEMIYGSKPVDDSNLLMDEHEKETYLNLEPSGAKFIRKMLSSHEFLHGKERYCFWLVDAHPQEIKSLPYLTERIKKVRLFREKSTKLSVREQAMIPSLFSEIRQPKDNFVLIPTHSSENRHYIPFGFFDKDIIVSNSCTALPNASFYHFGIISSLMHYTWIIYTCGRLESRIRYSNSLVYNNFPWPESPAEKQREAIEKAAQQVLDARKQFPGSSLADLYDPLTMPPALVKAHRELDRLVDLAYRRQPFPSETKRIEFLFELYDKYTAGLFPAEKKKKKVK